MSNDYVEVVIAVAVGIWSAVDPTFFAKTKGKSIHSDLYTFFVSLYASLCTKSVDASFFDYREPFFDGISKTIFEGAKEDCGEDVMASVKELSRSHLDECIELAGVIAVEMGNVLASQRGK